MSGRQTQSYLRNLFASRGIALRHRLGQNFLIDLNLHELLVREAAVESRDVILEVGCGAGALTSLLSERAGAVVAVEVDPRLVALACETLLGKANVRVIETDALEGKHALSAVLVDQLQAGLAVSADRTLKLVANLPYAIATPIITNLLVHPTLRPKVIGDHPERTRGADGGGATLPELQRAVCLGSFPRPCRDSPDPAPGRVLASTKGRLRDHSYYP
jgi:16S rRNA (adenine1518-N6/adenine1519-N6)-dimethyltransferase